MVSIDPKGRDKARSELAALPPYVEAQGADELKAAFSGNSIRDRPVMLN
jgi:hypothetical protein